MFEVEAKLLKAVYPKYKLIFSITHGDVSTIYIHQTIP